MKMDNLEFILSPVARYGFLGFSVVLLGVIIWLIQRLLAVINANNLVIAENTAAMKTLTATVSELMLLSRSLHDKIISRPCIARKERLED
jgi:cell division protein FtsB